MARVAAAVAVLGLSAEAVNLRAPHHGASLLATGNGMRPDVAAKTFVAVEDEWQAEAQIFADCQARGTQEAVSECVKAPKAFKKSCDTVVTAIMAGSSGEKASVKEYLQDVCGQSILKDWHKDRCTSLATAVDKVMTEDAYENRQSFATVDLCSNMWTEVIAAEKDRAEKEAKEEAEREAKRQAEEEARKKAEAEAEAQREKEEAEAKAKAEAEAAAEAKAKAEEEAAKQKAEKEAAEAKAKAPEPVALAANATKPANSTQVAAPAKNATKAK